ncbi:MAG: serine/threonine protein kinase [Labilithrix sp.]|nr:serine/threonine protein kinase [Labilithrix sp.]
MAEQSSADYRGSLGRYALYGEIAAGGMATVHLARLLGPVGFARTVAIKRLHPHLAKDPEFGAMFLEEARLAARVRHPNVVATLDVVHDDGELFLVMEYVAGESLSRLVRKAREAGGRVPPRCAVGIISGALEGLHSAHEALSEKGHLLGLVHRDVSPQNVHVGTDGVPRLLDFGIAKATNRVQETRTDQIKGKVAYMSPEQLAKGNIDRRADVYSAAVVLWETLTGQRLFKADDVATLVYSIINEHIEPPSKYAPDISPALDAVVMKGLEREADARWSTARDMAAALEKALAPAPAREISAWVHEIAGDSLEWRQDLVHRIESETSASMPPPMLRVESPSSPMDVRSGVVSTEDPRGEAVTISNESGAKGPFASTPDDERETLLGHDGRAARGTPTEAGDEPELGPSAAPKRHVVGIVMLVVAAFLLLGGGILFGLRWMQMTNDASNAEAANAAGEAAGARAPLESESAIVIGGALRNAPNGGASATSGGSSRAPAVPVPVRAPVAATPSVVVRDPCENPFTVDARGIRHPKPECFNKK